MISVCMALYNGQAFLRTQVQSVLSQLSLEDELVVSDDGSTDDSLLLLESFKDPRIRILRNKTQLGPIYNAERALIASRGDILFLCDQDDVWFLNKVTECCHALESADLVLHDACIMQNGVPLQNTLFQRRQCRAGFWRNLWKNNYTGCCMAFRRCVLDVVIPFPANLPMHDQWIGLIAERKFRVHFLKKVLMEYRVHDHNFTSTAMGSHHGLLRRFNWRWSLWKALWQKMV